MAIMGNGQPGGPRGLRDFAPLSSCAVEALGTVTLYRNAASGELRLALLTSYAIGNRALAESELEQTRRVNALKQVCKLVRYEVVRSQVLCLESFALHLVFEAHALSLSDCIAQQKHFAEAELWAMAECALVYLAELKALGLSDGDLQPKNVFCVAGAPLKFLNLLLFTTYQSAYRMKLAYRPYNSTFAPELLPQLKNCAPHPDYDPHKADVFSLGLCLLCAATATPFEHFYNFHDCALLQENVKRKLVALVEKGYSTELFGFLDACLLPSPFERPFLDALYRRLPGAAVVTSSAAFWHRQS